MSPPDQHPSAEPTAPPPATTSGAPRTPPSADGGDQDAYVIALDVGGTGMKGALLDRAHTPVLRRRRPTPRTGDPQASVAAVLDFAAELRDAGHTELGRPPDAAGVAVPGILDTASGTVRFAANLDWHDVPLRRLLAERLAGLPVALGHDVHSGGLAEGRLGAGRGARRFFFVPLGTGLSGAIGIDGRIEPGSHGGAGEIGHVVVRPGGERCGCGQYGCVETLASAAAVGRAWADRSGDPGATAADAAAAVAAGDQAATEVWQRAVDGLADGLLIAVTLLDPEVLIIGGGLAEAGDTLLDPLRAALDRRLTYQHRPDIIPAALGEAASCLGAGLLAWEAAGAGAPATAPTDPPGTGTQRTGTPGHAGAADAPATSPHPGSPPAATSTPRRFHQP